MLHYTSRCINPKSQQIIDGWWASRTLSPSHKACNLSFGQQSQSADSRYVPKVLAKTIRSKSATSRYVLKVQTPELWHVSGLDLATGWCWLRSESAWVEVGPSKIQAAPSQRCLEMSRVCCFLVPTENLPQHQPLTMRLPYCHARSERWAYRHTNCLRSEGISVNRSFLDLIKPQAYCCSVLLFYNCFTSHVAFFFPLNPPIFDPRDAF